MRTKGFTLIELLIVMGILAILTGFGIAQYNTYSQTQQLNAAANNVEAALSTARDRAVSQDKHCFGQVNDQFVGYEVYFSVGLVSTYQIYSICIATAGSSQPVGAQYRTTVVSQKTLSSNKNIQFKYNNESVQFFVLSGGAKVYQSFNSNPSLQQIQSPSEVEIDFGSLTPKHITIAPSGSITVQ